MTDMNDPVTEEALNDEGPIDPETTEPQYRWPVDEKHRCKVLKPWRFERPHHRAFLFAWSSFFLAFFGWFALSPLMKFIGENSPSIGIGEKQDKVTSNIVAVAGTIFMRFVIGPVADRFGPRYAQSTLLVVFSIPAYLVGTANSFATFTLARFFIGFLGATFVVTQYWTSIMFAKNVVGSANATSAGWGNLGGGVTNALMPQFLRLMQAFGLDNNKAWRVAMVIPASFTLTIGILLFIFSDDCPDGNYRFLIQSGQKKAQNPWVSFGKAAVNPRSWILHLTYATCFGVELVMNGNLATYFAEDFDLNTGTAGLVASLFGLMNLFARSLGGIASDIGSAKGGMTGRLIIFFLTEVIEGLFLLGFSRITKENGGIGAAIALLICFSIFVQMAEGATFGIVPYVDPPYTGAISGIVGAGGNVGAVLLNLLIRNVDPTNDAFLYLSFVVIGVAFFVLLLIKPFSISNDMSRGLIDPPAKVIVEEQEPEMADVEPIST